MEGRSECHYPALDVALHTGMHLNEQFTLEWGSVDFDRHEIRLDETKNGSGRTIPMNSACLSALRSLHKKTNYKADRVFRSVRGEPLDTPRARFETALADAQIKDFRWHDLRPTFCSRLAMAAGGYQHYRSVSRSQDVVNDDAYSHLSPSHNLSAID